MRWYSRSTETKGHWINTCLKSAFHFMYQNWPARPASRLMEWAIFKALFCKIFKLEHSENGTRYSEEIRRITIY